MNNEELQEKFEQLASSIDWIKTKLFDLQDEKGLAPVKTPYEVKVPEDIDDYVYTNNAGNTFDLNTLNIVGFEEIYKRGLAFKTVEEAEKYDKERILMFKMHKWAEEHNEGWTPDWGNREAKYYISYEMEQEFFNIEYCVCYRQFTKLPYFKSEEIVEQFIEEFGEEIKEVFC